MDISVHQDILFQAKVKQLAAWRTLNLQLLPTPVDPEEAEEMFDFADKNKDSKIGWEEFQVLHFHFLYKGWISLWEKQGLKNGMGGVLGTSLSLSLLLLLPISLSQKEGFKNWIGRVSCPPLSLLL